MRLSVSRLWTRTATCTVGGAAWGTGRLPVLWAAPLGSGSQDRVRGDGPCPEAARPDLRRKAEGRCWVVSEEPQGSGDASTGPGPTSLHARRR